MLVFYYNLTLTVLCLSVFKRGETIFFGKLFKKFCSVRKAYLCTYVFYRKVGGGKQLCRRINTAVKKKFGKGLSRGVFKKP